jgi:Arf-GAP with SH3 domain, ANK repeat and PH domain-containing protein
MRSLTLDTSSFNPSLVGLLRVLPNVASNSVWEHNPTPSPPKPSPQSPHEARQAYITAKYVEKSFVEPLPSSTSPNELLMQSIMQGDVKGILWALARKADPNTRTPVLPALVVAVQQDEKLGTSLGKVESGSSTNSGPQMIEFAMAELLLLNGANPVDPRTFPVEVNLSDAAKRYLQGKVDRALRNAQSPPLQQAAPKNVGLGISTTSSQGGSIGDLNRTVSKLQKRLSAGGKNFRAQLSAPSDKDHT